MNFLTRKNIERAHKKKRRQLRWLFEHLKHVGRNVEIGPDWNISAPQKVEIGDHVWIGEHFYAKGEGGIVIGSGTIISRKVEIWTQNHNYDSDDLMTIPYDKRMIQKPVTIGENVWCGTHVLIMPGAVVGEGVVIGAGSVVTGTVPDYAVIGGNPAKVIKYRNKERYLQLKQEGKIYLDEEYDYDKSSLRRSEW
ncbi:MAG: acyltransferase [Eubacterium sp.]|nr:acyltransferase [Eubacterium sp.]